MHVTLTIAKNRRAAPESAVSAVQQMYAQLTTITAHEVFQGQWQYQNVFGTSTAWRLMAWTWSTNDHKRLVVVNYSDTQGEGRVILSDAAPVNGNDTIAVTELFSGTARTCLLQVFLERH